MSMNFRTKHIADSVVERIMAGSDAITKDKAAPEGKGAATIHLERGDDGDLIVTKTFEQGEPELLTISREAPPPELPPGLVDVTPGETQQPAEQQPQAGSSESDAAVVSNAALGGDSITELLRT